MSKSYSNKYSIFAKIEGLDVKRIIQENPHIDFIEIELGGYTLDGRTTLLIAKVKAIDFINSTLGVQEFKGRLLRPHLTVCKGELKNVGKYLGCYAGTARYTHTTEWLVIHSHTLSELVSLRQKAKKVKEKKLKFNVTAL